MKALKFISFAVITVLAMTFVSCNDDNYNIGEPFDKVAGTTGEWTVKSVTLVNGEDEELDITSYFDFSTFAINLAVDKSFTVTGNAPDYLGVTSGTWKLDNDETPLYLQLTQGTTTSQFVFVAPPREGTNLKIKIERKAGDEVYASYVYELTKK